MHIHRFPIRKIINFKTILKNEEELKIIKVSSISEQGLEIKLWGAEGFLPKKTSITGLSE